MEKTTQLSDGTDFKSILSGFVEYLCSQFISVPLIFNNLQGLYDTESEAFNNYIKEIGLDSSKPDAETNPDTTIETISQKQQVPYEYINKYDEHLSAVKSVYFIRTQFLQTQFVDLISRYDIFLQGILRKVYYLFPGRLNKKEKKMLFEDISNLSSIDEFKKSFIDDILDTLFRGSHCDQLDYMRDELDFDVKEKSPEVYCNFIELTERRNILTHADGIIGDQYINVCKERGAKAAGIKGQNLKVDIDYFKKSCDNLLMIAIVIGYWFWTTRAKDEQEKADDFIISVVNRLIKDKRSDVALNILDYVLTKEKSHSKAIFVKRFKLYKLYALKILGKIEDLNAGLSEDWSDVNNSIKLKLLVLEDKFPDAIKLFKKIKGIEEGVNKAIFSESVIYNELIQNKDFRDTYKEVYGESFCYYRDSIT